MTIDEVSISRLFSTQVQSSTTQGGAAKEEGSSSSAIADDDAVTGASTDKAETVARLSAAYQAGTLTGNTYDSDAVALVIARDLL